MLGQYATDTGTGINTSGIAVSTPSQSQITAALNTLPINEGNYQVDLPMVLCSGPGCPGVPAGTSSGGAAALSALSGSTLTLLILGAVAVVGMLIAKGGH